MKTNAMATPRDVTYAFPDLNGDAKLKELILYISEKCSLDRHFGAVKLNKILHYSDVVSYAMYGRPITGVEYAALEQGPGARRMLPLKNEMQNHGDIVEEEREVAPGYIQRRIVPLRKANLEIFNGRDIAIIDAVIHRFWKYNAKQVSKLSHGRAWRIARAQSLPIPYEAAFISDDTVAAEADVIRGRQLAEKFGWNL